MRFALALGIVVVAAILLMSAAAFLCAALYLYLVALTDPPAAAALTGLAALIATIGILFASRFILGRTVPVKALPVAAAQAASAAPAAHEDPKIAQALSALVGEELGRAFKENPKGAAMAALAAGVAVGVSPKLRGVLLDLLERAR